MSKVTNLVLFISVIIILFNMAGLYDTTDAIIAPSTVLLGLLLNPQNVASHGYYGFILAAIGAAGTIGAIIGFFAGTRLSIILKASIFGSVVLPIILELTSIFTIIRNNLGEDFAILMISPLIIFGLISAVEWWQ